MAGTCSISALLVLYIVERVRASVGAHPDLTLVLARHSKIDPFLLRRISAGHVRAIQHDTVRAFATAWGLSLDRLHTLATRWITHKAANTTGWPTTSGTTVQHMNDTHQQTSLVHFGCYAAIGLHESKYPFLLLERNESGGWQERTPDQWAEALDLVEVCGAGDADRADAVLRKLAQMDEPQRSSAIDRLLLAGLAPILPPPTDETRRTIHVELTAAARKLMLTELDSWRAD